MPRKKPTTDDDNPEWSETDFARAKKGAKLPAYILKNFPKTRARGPQKAPTKVSVTIRLSRPVVEHYRAGGEGWQSRLDDDLQKLVGRRRRSA